MKNYELDEFFDDDVQTTLAEEVEKKIRLLYDFCILTKKKQKRDVREKSLRALLLNCANKISIGNIIHDILVGKITLNELLRRNGYACS